MPNRDDKVYYFFDIDCESRKIVGWGTETRQNVEVQLSKGFHRLFVSKGQYNKLVRQIEER